MSTLGLFCLLLLSVLGIGYLLIDPMAPMSWMNGKKKSDLLDEGGGNTAETNAQLSKNMGPIIRNWLLSTLYQLIILPITVIFALSNDVGNRVFGYVVLAILVYSWCRIISTYVKAYRNRATYKQDLLKIDDNYTVNLKKDLRYWSFRALDAIPVLYLWYLFLVGLKILPGLPQ